MYWVYNLCEFVQEKIPPLLRKINYAIRAGFLKNARGATLVTENPPCGGFSTHRLQPCGRHRVSPGYGGSRVSTSAETTLSRDYMSPIPLPFGLGTHI